MSRHGPGNRLREADANRGREESLRRLDHTVAEAVAFFCRVDGNLSDGHQTARQVISHVVFWHREFGSIARALSKGEQPKLRRGTFADLNAASSEEFKAKALPMLANDLAELQQKLRTTLQELPDWRIDFPIKAAGRFCSVNDRLSTIESHVRNHVARLKRAARKLGSSL